MKTIVFMPQNSIRDSDCLLLLGIILSARDKLAPDFRRFSQKRDPSKYNAQMVVLYGIQSIERLKKDVLFCSC